MFDERHPPAIKRWSNRPRRKDFDYVGAYAYHLIFNTTSHRPLLAGDLAKNVVDAIERAAESTSFELLAYTVMPNHVHLLVQGQSDAANAVRLIQQCKQRPGFDYRRNTGEHLWQASFYDRAIRRGDNATEIAEYILANPVRSGLIEVENMWRWPYSGGTVLEESARRS